MTYAGEQVLLVELAEKHGVSYKELHRRIFTRGWPVDKALTQPMRQFKSQD